MEFNSSAGIISIGNDADPFNIEIGTGAAQRDITIGNNTDATSVVAFAGTGACAFATNATDHTTGVGSVTGVSATTINAGTGGLTLNAAGIVDIVPAVDAQAAAASQQFTITNNVCTANSAIMVTVANKGANDANMSLERVTPLAGSFTLDVKNNGSQALNGDVIVTFWIIAA